MKWDGENVDPESRPILNEILAWIFFLGILVVVIWALTGCMIATSQDPSDPIGLSSPAVSAPAKVETQSFLTDLFGWTDVSGRWGGWLNPQYAIPVQLQLQYFTDYQANQVLGGWVIYWDSQLSYTISRAYTQGHFFWLVYYGPSGWAAIVAITDWGYRYTTNCGLFAWNPLIQGWDLVSACWFNR